MVVSDGTVAGWGRKYFEYLSDELPLLLQIAEAAHDCKSEANFKRIVGLIRDRTCVWAKLAEGCKLESLASSYS